MHSPVVVVDTDGEDETPVRRRQEHKVATIVSLLEVDAAIARQALEHCAWHLELAVDAACQLAAGEASASSAESARGRAPTPDNTCERRVELNEARTLPDAPSGSSCCAQTSAGASTLLPEAAAVAPLPHRTPAEGESGQGAGPERSQPSAAAQGRSSPSDSGVAAGHDTDEQTHVFADARPAKRPRLSGPNAPPSIRIPSCAAEPEAPQPPSFQRYPLRSEQLKSLHWMVRQEAAESRCERGVAPVRGGLLADRMGFGKTSTAIALISQDPEDLRAPGAGGLPRCTDGGQIPCDSTLVVCPAHLVQQWVDEFEKFLGAETLSIFSAPEKEERGIGSPAEFRTLRLPLDPTFFAASATERAAMAAGRDMAALCRFMLSRKAQFGIHTGELTSDALGEHEGAPIRSVANARLIETTGGLPGVPHPSTRGVHANVVPRAGDVLTSLRFKGRMRADAGGWVENCWVPFSCALGSTGPCAISSAACILAYGITAERGGEPLFVFTPESEVELTFRREAAVPELASPSPRGSGPFKILALHRPQSLWRLKVQDFSRFHVVIASAKIQQSEKYAACFHAVAQRGTTTTTESKLARLGQKITECSRSDGRWRKLLLHSPPLFEMMKWRRIVLDEFHESTRWDYGMLTKMRHLSADHKWGLTGTPPFGSLEAVAQTAALLGFAALPKGDSVFSFDAAGTLGKAASDFRWRQRRERLLTTDAFVRDLHHAAQKYVERFARQSASALVEAIRVVEHDEYVSLTNEERFMYRQACRDLGIYDLSQGYEAVSLRKREELLKRCAHFDMGEALTARTAVLGLGRAKRERIDHLEEQLAVEATRWRLHAAPRWSLSTQMRAACGDACSWHPQAQAALAQAIRRSEAAPKGTEELEATTFDIKEAREDGEARARPVVVLRQPVSLSEYHPNSGVRLAITHALVLCAARRCRGAQADKCRAALAILEATAAEAHTTEPLTGTCPPQELAKGVGRLVALLSEARRSHDFYVRQLQLLTREARSAGLEEECSICLGALDNLETLAILPCSHAFHEACARSCLQRNPVCPECRAPATTSQVTPLVLELEALSAPPQAAPEESQALAHGSKLHAVASRLRAICASDASAKIILFAQWTDLQNKICEALTTYGISFARSCLSGVLKRFQEDESSERVLVLSLQDAASGANLTSANHVVLLHPMNADSSAQAAAYERQAVARIRRIGQARPEVHLWRYVARDTVEEHLVELHAKQAT